MTLAEMSQGTRAWHEWRLEGIGASEVPIIMGESDWETPYQLWERKFHRIIKEDGPNWAQQRGTDAEPKIRALYELSNDMDMPAELAVHPELPFFRASLDGWNQEASLVLEIKYPSKEKHEQAKRGEVPECYRGQVQAQLFVAGARSCDYVSFDGERIAVVRVEPDPVYRAKMIEQVSAFWQRVLTGKAPEMGPGDVRVLDENKKAAEAFQRLIDSKVMLDQVQEQYDQAMEQAKGFLKEDLVTVSCRGVKLTRSYTRGSVDYTKIPELKAIDLEQYRKKGSFRVSPTFPKN